MATTINSFIRNRPVFQNQIAINNSSLLKENRQISHLLPSAQIKNKILLKIDFYFKKFLAWLYPFARTNYVGIVAAFDRTSQAGQLNLSTLDKQQLLTYFKKFFNTDSPSSPQVAACIDQLQKQYAAVEKLNQFPGEKAETNLKYKKLKESFQPLIRAVETLKAGQQKLILAHEEAGNELFYLFSCDQAGTHLKIIGRGEAMSVLSGVQEVSVAGKAKIPVTLNYRRLSTGQIKNILEISPLAKGSNLDRLQETLTTLASQRIETDASTHLATKTNNFMKLLQTTFKQVNANAGKNSGEISRVKLRQKLFTAFSILKEYRHTLSSEAEHLQTLERMLRICAQDLLIGHQKGIVSKSELDQLSQELKAVTKAIEIAQAAPKHSSASFKIPSMGRYALTPFQAIAPSAAPASPAKANAATHTRPPAPMPAVAAAPIALAQSPLELPINALHALSERSELPEIIHTVFVIPFVPYRRDPDRDYELVVADTPWNNLTQAEARALAEKLNALSTHLVNASKPPREFSIDALTALEKMTCMVAFLEHHILNQGVFTPDSHAFLIRTLPNSDEQEGKQHSFGYCVHANNARVHSEIYDFHDGIGGMANGIRTGRDHSKKYPGNATPHLRAQYNLFNELAFPAFRKSWRNADYFTNSVRTSTQGWIPSLPLPLLAVYHNLAIREGSHSTYFRTFEQTSRPGFKSTTWGSGHTDFEHRNTQEAIIDDPRSSIRTFVDFMMNMQISSWRGVVQEQLVESKASNTPGIQQATAAALRNQAEYLLRASQMGMQFTESQLTALLLLLRSRNPQSEIMAFLHTHTAMLSNPQVRAFVELLFFNPSLTNALAVGSHHHHLRMLLPQFLSNKIQEFRQRAVQDPEEVPKFIFFLQMSEKLQGIYTALGYEGQDFFDIAAIEADLAGIRLRSTSQSAINELIALQLKTHLKKNQLTQEEACQVILDRQHLKNQAHTALAIAPSDLSTIENRYQELMRAIARADSLTQEHYNHILDAICAKKQLPLLPSAWRRGENFRFENEHYEVDLLQGSLRNRVSGAIHTALPKGIGANPLFRKSFPDLSDLENLPVQMHAKADGSHLYCFEDSHRHQCQIEEKKGVYTFYKSLANQPQLLQAIDLCSQEKSSDPLAALMKKTEERKPTGVRGLFEMLKALVRAEKKIPQLPDLFQQGCFINPQNPKKGYILSTKGEFEFEVELVLEKGKLSIQNIYDLRNGKRSEARVVTRSSEVNHPFLKRLEQFEAPEHILLWGKKDTGLTGRFFDSSAETLEFPRYGLSFSLKNNQFVCNNPEYAGYCIKTSASIAERKGFAFSLLLEHPDKTKPQKLLLPPASSIISGNKPPKSYSGLAYVIWLVKTFIDMFIRKSMPSSFTSAHLHIESEKRALELISVDLHPHTKEIAYTPGKEILHCQELINQAVLAGDYELAFEVLHAHPIEKNERSIRQWINWAKQMNKQPSAAAVGLKALEKILQKIHSEESFKETRKRLRTVQVDLFKIYVQQGKKLPSSLRIEGENLQTLCTLLHKREPAYYQKHILPFHNRVGERIELPTRYTNGRETALPALAALPRADHSQRPTPIAQLEARVQPGQQVPLESLAQTLNLNANAPPLVLDTQTVQPHFNAQRNLTVEKIKPLNAILQRKQAELSAQQETVKNQLHTLLNTSADSLDQIAIFAKEKRVATPTELMLALYQNDLQALQAQGHLPQGIRLEQLKQVLIDNYDLEVKLHILARARSEIALMAREQKTLSAQVWALKSSALFELLTHTRRYSVQEHPDLLIFEAFNFMTYRHSAQNGQLDLLRAILANPTGITQAGTGSGKSSVLSILRALKKANGNNLVTYKVLPQLYQETLALMENRFEKVFKRKVYALRFDLRTPMQDREGRSAFIEMYQKMLETVEGKGCILTDYKSMPLLEEKFWSLNRELLARRVEGIPFDPIQTSHWEYLRKILILLKNKEDQLMDEFDEPNRPVHRIQMQIAPGTPPPPFMIEESLALYDCLLQQAPLRLAENLQGDIPEQTRITCMRRVAEEIARERATPEAPWEMIYNYLIGANEDVLARINNWTNDQKDRLNVLKDQFYTFLPLTLSRSGKTNYYRSKDGNRILTCVQGEPKEAKFGNILEEINYSIQTYAQYKVALPTARSYIAGALTDFKNHVAGVQQRFEEILPGASLQELSRLSPADLENRIKQRLLPQLNQRAESVRFFLLQHLNSLRCSGWVSSMTPQDCVSMSRAVGGVSASVGSLGALHEQFQTDAAAAQRVEEEMIQRFRARALNKTTTYDPANPLATFATLQTQRIPVTAVIDGAGAFRECSPRTVAERMLQTNPSLKKVEYYDEDGALYYLGDANAPLDAKGFYFPQAYTRGADQQLKPDAIALITVSEPGRMEDLSQHEGRMRLPGQKLIIACSQFAPDAMRTLDGIIARKQENQRAQNAEDRFRSEPQKLRQIMRSTAKSELLNIGELNPFLDAFERWNAPFIQAPTAEYAQPGDYFERHQHITPRNHDPIAQLNALRQDLVERSIQLGLPHQELDRMNYPETLRPQLPATVAPLTATETQQLEVEEEREEQNEIQQEQEMEEETDNVNTLSKAASYLPRRDADAIHSARERIHPAFDPRIEFTEPFLPLNRRDPLHRRTPFDERMASIGSIRIVCERSTNLYRGHPEIFRVTIGDILDDVGYSHLHRYENHSFFSYDIRTDLLTNGFSNIHVDLLENPEFKAIVAQIKFLNGQIEGYSPEELQQLTVWLQNNRTQEMRQFFEQRILRHKTETRSRYRHSQLWTHFEQLAAAVPA